MEAVLVIRRRGPRAPPPMLATVLSFAVALIFGAVTSGSIAFARATQGRPSGVVFISMAIVWAAIVLGLTTELLLRSRWRERLADRAAFLVSQLAGLVLAIVGAHVLLGSLSGARVVECPGQFVNDAALALPILAVVWSGAMKNRAAASLVILVTIVAVVLYAGTRSHWHFDPFPGAAVQQFVLAEAAYTCAALWIFDLLRALRRV